MTRVLVLCTHNSSRSQMAEGFLRALGGSRVEVASAGTEVTRVHTRIHWSFDDPSAAPGSETERLAVFRRVRDEIRARLVEWLATGIERRAG